MNNLSRSEIFAAVLLELGPMPHPDCPDYEQWYGGGFGTDMLGDDEVERHQANLDYTDAVHAAMVRHGHDVISDVEAFMKMQRKR